MYDQQFVDECIENRSHVRINCSNGYHWEGIIVKERDDYFILKVCDYNQRETGVEQNIYKSQIRHIDVI